MSVVNIRQRRYGTHKRSVADYDEILDFKKQQITEQQIKECLKSVKEVVSEERKTWLRSRTWWNVFHADFQSYLEKTYSGTHLVSHPNPLSISDMLCLNTVHIPSEQCIIMPMQISACHDNCYELYVHNPKLRIFTGYALSMDGLWRHHSWILEENGNIIETTERRLIYLGYDTTNLHK